MNLYHLISGKLPVNTYVLENNGRAVVIDGGIHAETALNLAKDKGFTVEYMLLTHTHFDHSICCKDMQKNGVKVGVCELEEDGLYESEVNLTDTFAFSYAFPNTKADFTFNGGDILNLCGIKIKVILTKGHSKGSCSFLVGDMLFSGDTLFFESIGRTDMFGGSAVDMKNSLKTLLALDENVSVYPGHGEETTIKHEKEFNLYI